MGLGKLPGIYETAPGRGTLGVRVQAKRREGSCVDMGDPGDETGKFKNEESGSQVEVVWVWAEE